MEQAFELAGFFSAHGIWCVSEGEDLIPLLGTLTSDGERYLERFSGGDLTECVIRGQAALESSTAPAAVLVYDTRFTFSTTKTDALTLDIRMLGTSIQSARMVVPYRNDKHPAGFAVFCPKFLACRSLSLQSNR